MKFRTIVLTGLLVCSASLAFAQGLRYESYYNWNFLGAGARARGMGGAFLATSDDGSAGTWNPAGFAYNEGVLTSLNWNLEHLSVDNNPVGYGHASGTFANIGFWSFIAPITLREHEFVLGATYNRTQDIFYEDGINAVFVGGTIGQTDIDIDLESKLRSVGSLANINLGFGTEIAPDFTFGAGINLAAGDRRDDFSHISSWESLAPVEDEFRDSSLASSKADIDYSGVYANFGLMYRTDIWSVGLVFTTPWTLTEQLDYQSSVTSVTNKIPSEPLTALFITKRKIEMPYSVGIGGAYHVSERLLVALDYQYRDFKGKNIATQQITEPSVDDKGVLSPASKFIDYPTNWYNLHQVRLGAEYTMETGYGKIPLRVGLHNTPSVAGNSSGTINELVAYYQRPVFDVVTYAGGSDEQNMGFGFSFGAGIYWSQIHLDAAMEFESFSSSDNGTYYLRTSNNGIPPYDRTKLADYAREYKQVMSRFTLNFTGYF